MTNEATTIEVLKGSPGKLDLGSMNLPKQYHDSSLKVSEVFKNMVVQADPNTTIHLTEKTSSPSPMS